MSWDSIYILNRPTPPTDTKKSYSLISYCIYNCIYNSIVNYHNEYSMEYSNLLTENVLRLSYYRFFFIPTAFKKTLFPDNHLQKGSAQCILLYHNTLPNTLDYSLWWNLLVSLASNNPFHLFGHCKGTFLWLKIICVTWLYLFSKHLLWPWQYS